MRGGGGWRKVHKRECSPTASLQQMEGIIVHIQLLTACFRIPVMVFALVRNKDSKFFVTWCTNQVHEKFRWTEVASSVESHPIMIPLFSVPRLVRFAF